MRYFAFFIADPGKEELALMESRAKQHDMDVRFMNSGRVEPANRPCLHYRPGIGVSWLLVETGSENSAMRYADKLFAGLAYEDRPIFWNFLYRSQPDQLSFGF